MTVQTRPAPSLRCQLPGAVYAGFLPAEISSTSSTVRSGTVLMVTRPVDETVIASVAAALLSGRSATHYASTSPNAK